MARHFSHWKVFLIPPKTHNIRKTFPFFSSGRRETPFLDARLRAQKYSANANLWNITTASPISSSSSTTTERLTTASPAPPKVYESGEDLTVDVLDDDDDVTEDDDDDEDDVDEEQEEEEDDSDFLVGKLEKSVFHQNSILTLVWLHRRRQSITACGAPKQIRKISWRMSTTTLPTAMQDESEVVLSNGARSMEETQMQTTTAISNTDQQNF